MNPGLLSRRCLWGLLGLLITPLCAWAETPPEAPAQAEARAKERPAIDTAEEDPAFGRRVQEVLRRYGADVHGCYGVALAEQPALAGEVLVRLWVEQSGGVSRVDVLKDAAGSGRLTHCLSEAMRHWRAPGLAGGEVRQVVFPLAFRSTERTPTPRTEAQAGTPIGARYVIPRATARPGPLPGGKLEARVLVTGDAAQGEALPQASLTHLLLKPSARLALHQHPGALELLYVLKGLARVRGAMPGAVENAETGDLVIVPTGAVHNIEAAPLAALELLQMFVPAGPERAYLDPSPAARAGTVPAVRQRGAATPETTPRIIKAAALANHTILDGKGSATLYLHKSGLGQIAVQRLEAGPGARIPEHQHEESDEIVYVVSGRGTMTVAGQSLPVTPGDAVHLPRRVPHTFEVTERLVAIQCYAPAGPEQRFITAPARLPGTEAGQETGAGAPGPRHPPNP
jgi:quercetin dioxygenase-like cupin family protein